MNTNAILMAAGLGSRMRPLTDTCPKPLIKVHGRPMIETMIEGLRSGPVDDIYVVTGYLGEQFQYLCQKYKRLHLIQNPDYLSRNNISSIYAARSVLDQGNTFICESDVFVRDAAIFEGLPEHSCYYGRMQSGYSDDWVLELEQDRIVRIGKGGSNTYNMVGVSYFTANDAVRLKECVESAYEKERNYELFWDEVVNQNISSFDLKIKEVYREQLVEIDTVEELRAVNESF